MTLTASIFIVIAISAERYKAICHPFSYRPALYKYALLVFLTTACLEIPRFFEFTLIDTGDMITYWTTDLMNNPIYISFTSYWDDLFATGIFPFVALVYFNVLIICQIRQSRQQENRFAGGRRDPNMTSLKVKTHNIGKEEVSVFIECQEPTNSPGSSQGSQANQILESSSPPNSKKSGNPELNRVDTKVITHPEVEVKVKDGFMGRRPSGKPGSLKLPRLHKIQKNTSSCEGSPHQGNVLSDKEIFRQRCDKSTALLISIVVIFVMCHIYRFIVQIMDITLSESVTEEQFMYCHQQGRAHVPLFLRLSLMLNHVFIVINSSINFVVYSLVGREFREKCKALFQYRVNTRSTNGFTEHTEAVHMNT